MSEAFSAGLEKDHVGSVVMESESDFVIFGLRGSLYGIAASTVHEIVQLPALSVLEEAPDFIAGIVNLRGSTLPIVNLDIHFGHSGHRYNLDDKVIIVSHGHLRIGILVSEVLDVMPISPEQRELLPEYQANEGILVHFITQLAHTPLGIVMLMDAKHLMERHTNYEGIAGAEQKASCRALDSHESNQPFGFFPEASEEERQILHQRAQDLEQAEHREDLSNLTPLAVLEINRELFGIDLTLVQEFAERVHITPVPCTPSHVIGNANLRGSVLTITDIRPILNMPLPEGKQDHKIVVLNFNDLVLGVQVDDVHDVVYASLGELSALPTSVSPTSEDFLQGTINYQKHVVSVIDLCKMLSRDALVIDEES